MNYYAQWQYNIQILITKMLIWVILVSGSFIMLVPFAWLLSSSLKSPADLWIFPPKWFPSPIMWKNYITALTVLPFHVYLKNTIIIVLFNMFGTIFSASLCAFGFTQYRFPGRDLIFMMLLSTMMLPGVVTIIPQFIIYRHLGWIDTFLPLIVPSFLGGGAFYIFLLRQFFRTISRELCDAARIDGCSELYIYSHIILPLSKPVLATVGVFVFLGTWNDFMTPLIYINSPTKLTLALGLAAFRSLYSAYTTHWNLLMAASLVMIIPVIIIFFCAQRYFVQGIVVRGIAS